VHLMEDAMPQGSATGVAEPFAFQEQMRRTPF